MGRVFDVLSAELMVGISILLTYPDFLRRSTPRSWPTRAPFGAPCTKAAPCCWEPSAACRAVSSRTGLFAAQEISDWVAALLGVVGHFLLCLLLFFMPGDEFCFHLCFGDFAGRLLQRSHDGIGLGHLPGHWQALRGDCGRLHEYDRQPWRCCGWLGDRHDFGILTGQSSRRIGHFGPGTYRFKSADRRKALPVSWTAIRSTLFLSASSI